MQVFGLCSFIPAYVPELSSDSWCFLQWFFLFTNSFSPAGLALLLSWCHSPVLVCQLHSSFNLLHLATSPVLVQGKGSLSSWDFLFFDCSQLFVYRHITQVIDQLVSKTSNIYTFILCLNFLFLKCTNSIISQCQSSHIPCVVYPSNVLNNWELTSILG